MPTDANMKNVGKTLGSVKVGSAALGLGLLTLVSSISYGFFIPKHKFTELREDNVENQWENIETVLVASRHHRVPLLLFDIDILPNIFVARENSWKDTLHRCKVLCKHHPEEKNVITFAALASKFLESKTEFMEALRHLGFVIHLSEVVDPRYFEDGSLSKMTPSYLWMARNDHVIHLTFLHERGDDVKYLWVAPVSEREWKRVIQTLAPTLSDGWHSMDNVDAKFPRFAQAYDMSHRFTGLPIDLDGHRVSVPYHIKAFLKEYRNSRFIECGQSVIPGRRNHHTTSENNRDNKKTDLPQSTGKIILAQIKNILDETDTPFWITGGTLLGWYRECSFIEHDSELDIALWITDFTKDVVSKMSRNGFSYRFNVDALENGDEVSFLNKKGHKVSFLLFERDGEVIRNIRTRKEDNQKFILTYPSTELCWTEFVGNKVRVPCDSLTYVKSYFGEDWNVPNEKWIWHIDAANTVTIR